MSSSVRSALIGLYASRVMAERPLQEGMDAFNGISKGSCFVWQNLSF